MANLLIGHTRMQDPHNLMVSIVDVVSFGIFLKVCTVIYFIFLPIQKLWKKYLGEMKKQLYDSFREN